mgnify:CR=1 FL=1
MLWHNSWKWTRLGFQCSWFWWSCNDCSNSTIVMYICHNMFSLNPNFSKAFFKPQPCNMFSSNPNINLSSSFLFGHPSQQMQCTLPYISMVYNLTKQNTCLNKPLPWIKETKLKDKISARLRMKHLEQIIEEREREII